MSKADVQELHNALQGLNEQVKYVAWLCEQLGYVSDSSPIQSELETV